jgi:nucleoside-diphosphate-sugar epimerase
MSATDITLRQEIFMRYFITGASGWIGSAAVAELLGAGHQVLGLARSDASAAKLEQAGAEVHRGDLDDLDSLRAGAQHADGVIHLGYNHDFSNMEGAAKTDRAAIEAFGDVLEGTDKPLLIASGLLGLAGEAGVGTERDRPEAGAHPRIATGEFTLGLADRGVRSAIVRFAPTVHGPGDYGFVAFITGVAREKGVSAYIEDGTNQWPAVHVLDAASLVRLTAESAPAATIVHAVAEQGIPTREIAEAIGGALDLPVSSITRDQAAEHFTWMARFFGAGMPASSALTRERLGWEPTHPGLIADIAGGAYTAA